MELFLLPLKFKPPSEELQPSAWERREGLLLFMFLTWLGSTLADGRDCSLKAVG